MKRIVTWMMAMALCLCSIGADSFGAMGPGGGGQGGGGEQPSPGGGGSSSSSSDSSLMYWWANNDEFAEIDESSTMSAYIMWTDNSGTEQKVQLEVDRAYRDSSRGIWGQSNWTGGSYDESANRTTALTPSNFDHSEVSSSTVVYYIDTSPYSINKSAEPEYSFMIEFDAQNGTHYYATFEESNVWQGWYLKDHICGGVDFVAGTPPIPEPNSALLLIIGCGIIGLLRKKTPKRT